MDALDWLPGTWRVGDQVEETWIDVGYALIGVSGTRGDTGTAGFEVMAIQKVEEHLEFSAWPDGAAPTIFVMSLNESSFDAYNPEHDFPQHVIYSAKGSRSILAEISGHTEAGEQRAKWKYRRAADPQAVPDIERADRDFDADAAVRGAAAWPDWFAANGAMIGGGARRVGREAILQTIGPVYEGGELRWAPDRSGLFPGGTMAWTVGHWTYSAGGTGNYVSIWAMEDGAWKIVFDTGIDAPL